MSNAKNKPSYKLIKLLRAVPLEADLASEVYQTYEPDQNAISQPFISLSLSLFILNAHPPCYVHCNCSACQ